MPQQPAALDRRPRAIREAELRRSRRRLVLIILTAIVVPIAVTVLFIGSERAQGIAVAVLAAWLGLLGFLALFQRPIARSRSSWSQPGDGPPGMGTN